jgi:hypothetical protein
MAHYSGKAGQVDAAADVTGVKAWTLDYVVEMLETTDFADAGVRTYVAGPSGWSGSFEGLKDGVALAIGAAINIALKETQTATQKWTGSAFITGAHAAVAADGLVEYSYDFQGTGVLTVPTA